MKAKNLKRQEALERNAEWANLAPHQQLMYLDFMGLNAAKQRTKISKALSN